MTIRYKCAECGAALNIKDELAGTRGSCPRCQVEFIVPAPEGQEQPQKEPAPARKAEGGKSGDLSDDDIERFLQESGPTAANPGSRLAVADNGDEDGQDEEDLDEKPRGRKKKARAEDDDDFDDDEDEEEDEDDERERRRKKKKLAKAGAKKSDSSESASIARELMARGEKGATREDRGEKRAGRPFGGRDRPEDEQGFTLKEQVLYLLKQAWPYLAAAVFLIGIVIWALKPSYNLPPLAYVTGTVKLDGKPLEAAYVEFQPVRDDPREAIKLASSIGITNDAGQYVLVYLDNIPGAVIGKCTVRIRKPDETKGELLPARYNYRTELTADVKKGGEPINFDNLSSATGSGDSGPLPGAMQQ